MLQRSTEAAFLAPCRVCYNRTHMTYESEHRRMRPVLEKARRLDISQEPAPKALYDPLLSGSNIWCTPDDHPAGWEGVKMDAGAFSRPCEYVATVTWGWTDERITHVELETEAYALRDRDQGRRPMRFYRNRTEDVAWAKAKVEWLFQLAGMECLPILVDKKE